MRLVKFRILKYDPSINISPCVVSYVYGKTNMFSMVLDELFFIKNNLDNTLTYRCSCREGICGSCATNINGNNTLACINKMINANNINIIVYPLAHMPIIKDIVVSLKHFYNQYKSIQPWIYSDYSTNLVQTKKQRFLLDGLYECILCACCSTSCPSYWWNSTSYLGPAILLQAYRWIIDSRDINIYFRLYSLNDTFKLYRCHSIMNCSQVCPKNLNPALVILNIKKLISNYLVV